MIREFVCPAGIVDGERTRSDRGNEYRESEDGGAGQMLVLKRSEQLTHQKGKENEDEDKRAEW